jgi:hypothetical protein
MLNSRREETLEPLRSSWYLASSAFQAWVLRQLTNGLAYDILRIPGNVRYRVQAPHAILHNTDRTALRRNLEARQQKIGGAPIIRKVRLSAASAKGNRFFIPRQV